jgi:hypothetical protein
VSGSGRFSHETAFPYRTKAGRYRLLASSVALNDRGDLSIASVVVVDRNRHGGFRKQASWRDLEVTRSSGGLTPLSDATQPL